VETILSWAWLAIAAWLIVRAFNQRGLLEPVAVKPPPPADRAPAIAVIVPARNEAGNIGACLKSLIEQDYPPSRLSIVVVDDHSGDATPASIAALARDYPQVRLLRAPPLPPHWIGKSHACWIGARAATDAEWLCFLDADVRGEPVLLSSAVAAAQSEGLDLLSLAPRQDLQSFAERLVIPCGLIIVSFCQDLRKVQASDGDDATATGQFMLVRACAYDAAGGHAAISGAICEDTALARLLKQQAKSVVLRGGKDLVSARMYTGWRTLWPGFAKNLVDLFGGPVSTVTIALAAVTLAWAAWLSPAADALSCHSGIDAAACTALPVALIASASIIGLHVAATVYFRIPFWYGLLFPIGYTVGALIAFDSVRRRLTGRVSWKGRTYP
jgi:chlorobactene glucosyltransferase